MPGTSDNTLKHLTELSPQDWVIRGGWSAAPASLIDADIATISGAADEVIRVASRPDWLLAVDFHAGHDIVAKLPDILLYNSALFKRHDLSVRSLLVVLHRGADSPQLTGFYERGFPGEPFDVALRYRVVRVWEVPAQQWLLGGLGSVPLAPLGDVRPTDLPAIIAQMKERFDSTMPPRERAQLWSATYILMGLRYEQELIQKLLQGVVSMKESVTYQAILDEGKAKGKAEEARKILLLLGRDRFGAPSAGVQAALNALADVTQLEALTLRLQHATTWQELLGLAVPRRRFPRRKLPS